MKASTGTKILAYGMGILTILALSVFSSVVLLMNYENRLQEIPVFNTVRISVNPVLNVVGQNYGNLSDYDKFYSSVTPELRKIQGKLQIIDLSGNVLFDSEDKKATSNNTTVNLKAALHYDTAFSSKNPDLVKFAFPVVLNNKQVANAIFILPKKDLFDANAGLSPLSPFWPLLAGAFFISIILILLLKKIFRDFLKPIENLNNAAAEISKGNLDFKLEYKEGNEVGAFTQSFDLMRADLKDSIMKKSQLEKERKELVAAISHEIKTPLTYIKAYAEGLRDGIAKKPEEADKYIEVIITKTDSLTKLVNDLLQHSIQDLGHLKVNLEEHYSKKLLLDIIQPLRLQFANSNISLDLEGEIPDVLIKADAARIEQVIINIIQNAKKYGQGGRRVTIKTVLEDDCLWVSIQDNGYGIPPEEISFIFDRFYRGDRFRTKGFDGAGLGLSICKNIIEEHGGIIFAESIPGKGSTFHFTIPKI